MQVPFLDLKLQYKSIKEEVGIEIQKVLDNTAYILGKPVSDFENNFILRARLKKSNSLSSRRNRVSIFGASYNLSEKHLS